jgi:DNA-directed RNA polymerase sigma subunit (sigma70/sigma32)
MIYNNGDYDLVLDDILISVLNIGLLVLPAFIIYNVNKILYNREKDHVEDELDDVIEEEEDEEIPEMDKISEGDMSDDEETSDDDVSDCGLVIENEKEKMSETEMNDKIRNILDDLSNNH